MVRSFKELVVWQKGIELVQEIYKLVNDLPKSGLYGLSDQMRRAAISIPSNVAEGQRRKNIKEFLQFLRIAYGSSAELETQLILVTKLYPKLGCSTALSLLDEIQKMLNSIISKLTTN